MAGHSKWANIKHTKQAADAKRGQLFTKLTKEIIVAAKLGGGDPSANSRLRRAIQEARAMSMPKSNIERSIKKGTGDLKGVVYEEITFEGYGSGGVAVLVECLTDNRNRTVSEVRFIFQKGNGNLGEQGCVNWMFRAQFEFVFDSENNDFDQLQEVAIEAGADDLSVNGDILSVYSSVEQYESLKNAFKHFVIKKEGFVKMPSNTIRVSGEEAKKVIKLIELLEANDDVQKVFTNFEVDDEELENLFKD